MFSNFSDVETPGKKTALDAPIVVSRVDVALILIMAALAVYFFIYPLWRSRFLIEIWFTEGWNAYFQDVAASGGRIYPSASALIVNNYPPLSFYTIGLLGSVLGDNLFVGRALSLISLVVVSIEVFACARILAGGVIGPALGALWYAAIMSHNFTSYVGANDPQLAGEAIMGFGLAWLLRRHKAGGAPLGPLLVMIVGGFWKHNMIAIPLTAVVWLFARRGRQALASVAISILAAAVGLAACGVIFGADFFRNLLTERSYSLGHVLLNIGHLQWSAPAAVIWLSWVFNSRSLGAKFTSIHVPVALASCLLQWTGDAIFGNAEFDWIIALGIAIGVTCASIETSVVARYIGSTWTRAAVVALLVLRLIATDRQEPLLILMDPQFRRGFEAGEQSVRKEATQVAAINGDVYCDIKIVCRMAGKPFAVDDFKAGQMLATKRLSQSDLDALLASRRITTFKDNPIGMGAVSTSLAHAIRHARAP
ncbi:DUF1761 domain-containing protein [Bradyrhizobium sp. WSM2254]|uniref:DUF1761 domain-containing protein n=1 Tax=Bradyrhizobium sp. WSM2254 TaxID=1188263 RepID=UPI00041633F2|nr:DUF1761 domain-containing protein [Bradyrhizobium sp. WSM2254]